MTSITDWGAAKHDAFHRQNCCKWPQALELDGLEERGGCRGIPRSFAPRVTDITGEREAKHRHCCHPRPANAGYLHLLRSLSALV